MPTYRLTIRHGSRVERERYDQLPEALAEMERRAAEIGAAGPLPSVKALRAYAPGDRVAARLELSTGGWLRGTAAGVDLMGDGSMIPFSGGVRRRTIEPADQESALEAVRRALGS